MQPDRAGNRPAKGLRKDPEALPQTVRVTPVANHPQGQIE